MAASSSSAFVRNTGSRVLAASVAAAFPSLPINDASASSSNSAYAEAMGHSEQSAAVLNNGTANVQVNEGHFSGGDVEDMARTVFGGGDAGGSSGNFRRLLSAASTLPPEVKSLGTQLAKDPDIQRALIKHFHAKLIPAATNASASAAASPHKDDSKTTAATSEEDFGVREIPLSDAEDDEEFHSPTPVASSAESSAVLVEPEVLARDQQLLEQFRISAMATPTPPVRLSRMTTPLMEPQPGEEGVPRVPSALSSGKNEVKESVPAVAPASAQLGSVVHHDESKSSGGFADFVNSISNGAARVAAKITRTFEQIFSGLESYVNSFYQGTKPEDQPGAEMHSLNSSSSSASASSSSSAASTSSSSPGGLRDVMVGALYFAGALIGVLVLWKAVGGMVAVAAASTV